MITEETAGYLEVIFSDADLIDIDFSHWDTAIRICVIADHVPTEDDKWRTILLLSFRGVRKIDFSFHHHNFTKYPQDWCRGDHFRWDIYQIEIKRDVISQLNLSGSEQFPVLTMQFEDVDIEVVKCSVLKEMNSAWDKPGAGLSRPGIMELHRLISCVHKQKKGASKEKLLTPISEFIEKLKKRK